MELESINIVLFDDESWENLLPICLTKPTAQIRIGISTIFEKWVQTLDVFQEEVSYLCKDYLSIQYPLKLDDGPSLFINGSIIPNPLLLESISELKLGECLVSGEDLIAFKSELSQKKELQQIVQNKGAKNVEYKGDFIKLNYPWDIFLNNAEVIKDDFDLLEIDMMSLDYFGNNQIIGSEDDLYIAGDSPIVGASFNTLDGPIYIAQGAQVMEGALIRGPFVLCEKSVVKMGAKIYGGTTIGPYSKVGGELSNVVIQGYSNKGHDGYLGNSVIGEWCNLGADSNCSNLKNNYSSVKVWNYKEEKLISSEQQFCGLIMGDHSKCGINTMFNTGTVVGVFANIFGGGFFPKHIPSFSWGNLDKMGTYQFDKAIETARRVMNRREVELKDTEIKILEFISNYSSKFRPSESDGA